MDKLSSSNLAARYIVSTLCLHLTVRNLYSLEELFPVEKSTDF